MIKIARRIHAKKVKSWSFKDKEGDTFDIQLRFEEYSWILKIQEYLIWILDNYLKFEVI